ncbi:MAG TPA: hydroxymethylbilane synthase, partial [Amnibacterium sp.]|nr:hydroxymethylbilane synthase [Amnibacterium sp.]
MTIRIGTRGSALALAQAGAVGAAIEAHGEPWELVIVRTEGDVSQASL